jgi:hypothetical protein
MNRTATRPFNLLQTFHTAINSHGDDHRALALEANEDVDLLDLVEDKDVVDLRTEGQARFMDDLIGRLTQLDPATGETARTYTLGMTEHGKWTPGRDGNASAWIDRMIQKERALKAAAPAAPKVTTGEVEIPANYYGITRDGEVKCYQVDYGKDGTKWAGFLFLSRVSSDDRFAIKNPAEKASILAAIREDVEAAQILAGLTMRRCRRCGRGLSDTKNPYFSVALGPDCGAM